MLHNCKELKDNEDISWGGTSKEKSEAFRRARVSCYGPAVKQIVYVENLDIWVATNGEYATAVKFCPFCGVNLKELFRFANAVG